MLLIDWTDISIMLGFDKSKTISEKIAEELFIKRGFKVVSKIDVSINHYGIIFKHEE